VLSVSVCVITVAHLELFDFGRLQAWAWLVLLPGFALATSALLIVGRPQEGDREGVELVRWTRALLGVVAAVLAAIGLGLWVDPAGLPPLGGRFAGSWTVMLGFLADWAAIANRRDDPFGSDRARRSRRDGTRAGRHARRRGAHRPYPPDRARGLARVGRRVWVGSCCVE
jgi:hypothetical protein